MTRSLAVVGPCVDQPDADALRVLGIDFDEVRRRAEETFGPGALERTRAGRRAFGTRIGAIPFTPRAKEALELALQAALARGDKAIGSEHVLLGIVDQDANVGLAVLAELRHLRRGGQARPGRAARARRRLSADNACVEVTQASSSS